MHAQQHVALGGRHARHGLGRGAIADNETLFAGAHGIEVLGARDFADRRAVNSAAGADAIGWLSEASGLPEGWRRDASAVSGPIGARD